jgi:ABC-2 type transport system permease protein
VTALAGTGALVRLALRRDRILLSIWVLLLALIGIGIAAAFDQLYPTAASIQVFANEVAASPPEVALLGPVFAPTLGGLTAWRWSMIAVIYVGLANLLTVIRHTRTEEETGRRELLGATVMGRHAPLSAALIVTFSADLVIAALVAGGLMGLGLPVAGSLALGLSAAAVGWLFAALAGVAAQLTQSAGAARGIGGIVLAVVYLLRVVGDVGEGSGLSWLSWLSPAGWMRQIRPFAGERWWIFALFVGVIGVLIAGAFALSSRRDLDAGLLPPRLGPATASPGLRDPLALAWRLQRRTLLAWTAAMAVFGTALGFVAKTATDQLIANPQLEDFFARLGGKAGVGDAFFTLALALFGEVLAVYAIQAALRLRSEEMAVRADPVLATPVGRLQWAASHLVFAALGPAIALVVFGLSAGLTYGLNSGDTFASLGAGVGHEVPRALAAALAYLPAVWVLAGIAVALFGLLPRFLFLSWATLATFVLLELAGELQLVNQAVLDLSPFTHVPRVLVHQGSAVPLVWLLGITALLTIAGLAGFRRRDVCRV